jgi:hypothetical protein
MSHDIEDGVGGWTVHLAHDAAIRQEHDTVRVRGGEWIVGHHDDRLPELRNRVAEEVQQIGARARIQVAGRLVSEDDLGLARERTGGGDALLLASGKLIR